MNDIENDLLLEFYIN